jgi:hypothetical protein
VVGSRRWVGSTRNGGAMVVPSPPRPRPQYLCRLGRADRRTTVTASFILCSSCTVGAAGRRARHSHCKPGAGDGVWVVRCWAWRAQRPRQQSCLLCLARFGSMEAAHSAHHHACAAAALANRAREPHYSPARRGSASCILERVVRAPKPSSLLTCPGPLY